MGDCAQRAQELAALIPEANGGREQRSQKLAVIGDLETMGDFIRRAEKPAMIGNRERVNDRKQEGGAACDN